MCLSTGPAVIGNRHAVSTRHVHCLIVTQQRSLTASHAVGERLLVCTYYMRKHPRSI